MSAGKTVPIDTRQSCSESDEHQRCSGMAGISNPSGLRMLKEAFVNGLHIRVITPRHPLLPNFVGVH
jgi:hypothetical protein